VRSQSAVFVIGTGLAVASTNGSPSANWLGLIEAGIDQLVAAEVRDVDWGKTLRSMISMNETSFVIQAATQVGDTFKSLGDVAYAKWLQDTVGSLSVIESALAVALTSLPIPLLTTNYDTLLEQVSDRSTATWLEPGKMQKILANRSKDVGHLHGVWSVPNSVVLTAGDYEELVASESAKAIQYAFGATKSTIYVGVGSGLLDPNFSRFLDWQKRAFPNPGLRDFRLCTDSELPKLQALHIADNISVVSYGKEHADLVPFLESILDSLADIAVSEDGLLFDPVGEIRADFSDELRAEVIVNQQLEDDTSRPLEDLILPPVLLPVPHAQYVSSKSSDASLSRIDPESDLGSRDVVLLVGEENSGLTFTAKWLALKASQSRPLLAPLYVNFTQAGALPKPLVAIVRKQARAAGFVLGKKDPIPPLAIAIDDFSPYVTSTSDRVLRDLVELQAGFAVVACKQGTEEDVERRLTAAGLSVRVRYVGRLERSDIEELARIAAPLQSQSLAKSVIDLLRSENLPRTPYTVSQLLYILLKSGTVGTNASTTSILEEFVALLLGRGDAQDDARVGLDHVQRMAILERLAETFVLDKKSGVAESAVVGAIEAIIDALGWPDSAIDVTQNFIDRHVLAKRDGFVVFARSSYLHLFAAKQAQKSLEFRDHLLARPIYYGAAISDYASLNRHDDALLDTVEKLLLEVGNLERTSTIFSAMELAQPSFISVSIDEQEHVRPPSESESGGLDVPTHLEDFEQEDPPPFPVANEDDVPHIWRHVQAVDLSSRILRDADQAGDLDRKQHLLGQLLKHWGDIINELDTDEQFQEFISGLSASLLISGTTVSDEQRTMIDTLQKIIPAAFAFGAISETLASRKLLKAMKILVDGGTAAANPESAVASVFFLAAVDERGWPAQARAILKEQQNSWIIRNFVAMVLLGTYLDPTTPAEHDDDLLECCVEIVVRSTHYSDGAERKRHTALIRSNFRIRREKERKKIAAIKAIALGRPAAAIEA